MQQNTYNTLAALWPQPDIKDANFYDFGKDIVFRELSNGLRVLMLHDPLDKGTFMQLWINAGAMHQSIDQRGIAHLTEHMVHEGTKKFNDKRDLIDFVDDFNLTRNASTGSERQSYFVFSDNDAESLHAAATCLTEIVFNPTLPEHEFAKEQQIVISERKRYDTSPGTTMTDVFRDNFYTSNHPLAGGNILGTVEDISKLTLQNVKDFYNQYFVPQNMILTICGGAEIEVYQRLVDEFFQIEREGSWSPNPLVNFEKAPTGQQVVSVEKDFEHIFSSVFVSVPRELGLIRFTPELPALNIAEYALFKRVYQEIREKRGLAYTVDINLSRFNHRDYILEIEGEFAPEHYKAAKEVIFEIFAGLKDFSISDDEMRRAIKRKTSQRWMRGGREMLDSVADDLYMYGQFISPNYYYDLMRSVDKDLINESVRKFLAGWTPEIVEVGPLSKVQ